MAALEAEVLWGEAIRQLVSAVQQCSAELNHAMDGHIRDLRQRRECDSARREQLDKVNKSERANERDFVAPARGAGPA